MPELTEVTDTKPREEENDSGTDSDGDDSIPELEDTAGDGGAGEASGAAAVAGEEGVSKNKQSRGEKKARKIMSKLGLKQVWLLSIHFVSIFKCFIKKIITTISYSTIRVSHN